MYKKLETKRNGVPRFFAISKLGTELHWKEWNPRPCPWSICNQKLPDKWRQYELCGYAGRSIGRDKANLQYRVNTELIELIISKWIMWGFASTQRYGRVLMILEIRLIFRCAIDGPLRTDRPSYRDARTHLRTSSTFMGPLIWLVCVENSSSQSCG